VRVDEWDNRGSIMIGGLRDVQNGFVTAYAGSDSSDMQDLGVLVSCGTVLRSWIDAKIAANRA
jgi:hypothetical protein